MATQVQGSRKVKNVQEGNGLRLNVCELGYTLGDWIIDWENVMKGNNRSVYVGGEWIKSSRVASRI